jgi:putative flippase GtrA
MIYFKKEVTLFLVMGALNTLITYLIYLFLISFFTYNFSYSLSFLSGIIISYYLNSKFVFKQGIRFDKFIKYPFVYLIQYVGGLILLNFFIQNLHVPATVAPLLIVLLLTPASFILTRRILKEPHSPSE